MKYRVKFVMFEQSLRYTKTWKPYEVLFYFINFNSQYAFQSDSPCNWLDYTWLLEFLALSGHETDQQKIYIQNPTGKIKLFHDP